MSQPKCDGGWNHVICDVCWTFLHPGQQPARGTPALVEELGADTCCYCGRGTDSGIFVREDPAIIHGVTA